MSRSASAFCITHPFASVHPVYLSPFAMWTAFPSSDYYGDTVAMGFAPFRQSRVPTGVDVLGRFRCPVRVLMTAIGSPVLWSVWVVADGVLPSLQHQWSS